MKWMGKNSKPESAGWFYVRNHNGKICMRYYDDWDKAWWLASNGDGFRPNDSFIEWLFIKGVSDKQTN